VCAKTYVDAGVVPDELNGDVLGALSWVAGDVAEPFPVAVWAVGVRRCWRRVSHASRGHDAHRLACTQLNIVYMSIRIALFSSE
jgi:hypothetical protein